MQGANSDLTEDILVLGGSIEVAGGGVIDATGKTLGEIAQEISAQGNVSASIQDGKFTIKSENGEVSIVAQGDFARVSGIGSYVVSSSSTTNVQGAYKGSFINSINRLTEEEAIAQGYTVIKTADDLNNIRNNLTGKYILMNDIDLSVYTNWDPIGERYNAFTGSFNGNGFKITGLTVNQIDEYGTGLFGWVENATIQNTGIENANVISDHSHNGILIGSAHNTQIINCYTTGSVSGGDDAIGAYTGGLVGLIEGGSVLYSHATAMVSTSTGHGCSIGGLIGGAINGALISYSYADSTVSPLGENEWTGGFIGQLSDNSSINNSYATGTITSSNSNQSGGFIGVIMSGGSVTNSFCAVINQIPNITNYRQGFLGNNFNNEGTITNSYWDTEKGRTTQSQGGTGLTTAQFADKTNFSGWDESIWDFSGTTPTLKDQNASSGSLDSSTITGSVNTNNLTDNYFWGQTDGQLAFSNGVIVSISATDSRSDVIQKINDSGLSASINSDGKIQITADGVSDLTVTSDSSGFSDFYGLDGTESSFNGSISTSTETIPDPDGGDVTDPDGGDGGSTTDPGNPDNPPLDIAGLVTHGVSNIRLQIGKDGSDLSALYCDTTFIFDDFSLDFSDEDSCANSLEALEAFSDAVIKKQSDIGIYITRLESIYQSNSLKIQNTYSAYSTVMDADIAQETQKYVYNQIRQQTAASLLAQIQASRTQMVMTLLSSIM